MFATSLLITKHFDFTWATVSALVQNLVEKMMLWNQDTFADARQNDVQNLAEEMEDEIEHDRKALAKVFQRTIRFVKWILLRGFCASGILGIGSCYEKGRGDCAHIRRMEECSSMARVHLFSHRWCRVQLEWLINISSKCMVYVYKLSNLDHQVKCRC